MARTIPEYHVHLTSCLQSNVLAVCNVLKTILANEESAHSVSRPPIFSSSSIQMAQDLLQNVHDNDATREIVHVLPGSHNLCFKLQYEHNDDAGGLCCYKVLFCYKDKRPSAPEHIMAAKRCRADHNSITRAKRSKRASTEEDMS